MSLSATSINRPVLTIVLSIVIIVFGFLGFNYLGVREYPSVDPPVITVSTVYTGANADIIESQITEPLEESINGIAGVESITSTSREGSSSISVEFDLDIDLEQAANDVRDRVSRAVRQLPQDVDSPVVAKADADASPILFLSVKSESRTLMELSDIANRLFKEKIQTIPGVSSVAIWGEKKYSMRIWMDPAKLAAYSLSPLDIRAALQAENIELPSGRIEGSSTELTVRTMGRLKTADDFNNLILKTNNGQVIKLLDVGYATLGPENERTILKRGGVPMVGVVVIPQPGSSHIQIADAFYKKVEQIKKDLPDGVEAVLLFDTSKYIRASIEEVEQTIYIALGLVILIIFAFLRSWRTTLIPILAIPVSLIGTFFIMYIAHFSINVLTLLGIVLAIGLVVDDAIVVLENIYSKIEKGMDPKEAGFKGSSEIFFAVISTTIALAAVFLPIIFLEGLTGRLFREFGVVVAGSVIISAFVALTLTPMLSTKLLKRNEKHSDFYLKTEPFFEKMILAYKTSLQSFMSKRWLAFAVMAVCVIIIFWVGALLKSELSPLEDRNRVRINATAQEGASYEYMSSFIDNMASYFSGFVSDQAMAVVSLTAPGSTGSVNSGFVIMMLKDRQDRSKSQQEIADEVTDKIKDFTGAKTIVLQDQSFQSRGGGLPVQFVIQAPNFEKLKVAIPKFLEEARKDPTFSFVDVNLKFNKPEIKIEINRDRARSLGVSAVDIGQTLSLAFSGQRFGYFIMDGKQYQIIGQMSRQNRTEPLDLKSLYVKNKDGILVQLDNVVTLSEQSSPPQLYRFNRYISATVSAGLAKDKSLGEGIDAMKTIAKNVLDDSFSTSLDGTSRQFAESSSSLVFAFALALLLIFLVLSAQFESFVDPLVIMFTVPLALGGAILSLWYFNQTLNIFSQIGIIMLVGLVTKNGILIVEFANQRKEQGLKVMDAIQDAAVSRFRPILMTSLSTILGALPIALALGAGSESRVSMGIAVIGGLIFSGFLTLYVVPAIYSYLSRELNPEHVSAPEMYGEIEGSHQTTVLKK